MEKDQEIEKKLHTEKDGQKPQLQGLDQDGILKEKTRWLEKSFEKEEIRG